MRFDNPQVEGWVLGALADAEGLRTTAGALISGAALTEEHFGDAKLRRCFGAIRVLAERGRPTDCRSVAAVAGPEAYEALRPLQAGNTLTLDAFRTHAEELRRLLALRRLEAFHRAQLRTLAEKRPEPAELLQAVDDFAATASAAKAADETGESDMLELLEDWDAYANGIRAPYVPTGIETLDAEVGGFVPNLNVIGGLESVGKSALVAEVVFACLERGLRVGLFGLEDATKWLTKRQLARRMLLPVGQVAACSLDRERQEMLQEVAGEVVRLTRNLLVFRQAGVDPTTLVQTCKHWVLNRGCQLILVDHGGEVQHEAHGARDRFDLAVAATYRQLRDLAVNYRVPVVVLCHFNREAAKESGPPSMAHFAETHYIARMARLALGLWRKPDTPGLRCTVLKRTEGRRGVTVELEDDASYALVKRRGGRVVDLGEERRSESAAAKEAAQQAKAARVPRVSEWTRRSES